MVPPGSGLLLGRVPGVRHGGPPHLYGTSNDGLPHLGVSHVLLLQLQLRLHGGDDLARPHHGPGPNPSQPHGATHHVQPAHCLDNSHELPHLGVSHVLLLQLQLHGGDDLGLLDSLLHLQVEFN